MSTQNHENLTRPLIRRLIGEPALASLEHRAHNACSDVTRVDLPGIGELRVESNPPLKQPEVNTVNEQTFSYEVEDCVYTIPQLQVFGEYAEAGRSVIARLAEQGIGTDNTPLPDSQVSAMIVG